MDEQNIAKLPSSALTLIASYLAVPSRAIFAVALSVTSEESLAIVGTQWDILDFGRIHKDLAAKLTDDHIKDVLLSVNAVNRVKRLILSGCVNITGAGLEPLRGSLVIEQIDLGLVGDDESPALGAEYPLSCDHVLPILVSIFEQERCALKHLHFPNAWCSERSIDSDFHQLILRYNQMWARRQEVVCCSECSGSLPQRWEEQRGWVHDVGGPWIHTDADDRRQVYGIHRHTCHGCLENYCLNCESFEKYTCIECYRMYCDDCSWGKQCQACYDMFCSGCSAQKLDQCRGCGDLFCDGCRKSCYSCGIFYCERCIGDHWGEDFIQYTCDQCDKTSCGVCSPVLRCAHDYCEWQCCGGCAKDLFPWADQSCPDCGNFYCDDHMAFCSTCDDDGACCNNCRVKRTLEGSDNGSTCGKCCQLLVPLLKERIEELTRITILKEHIEELKRNLSRNN